MANFDQLKQSVAALIRTNGAEEITGAIMQDVLLTIINSISGGYMFGGVAQHNGNVGNPDYNVFYLAGSGAYTGYGGAVTIENGCYGVFRYNGTWHQEVVDIGVRLSGSIVPGETRGVTGDTINTALQQLFENITNILDSLEFSYNTPSAQQATKAMLDVIVTPTGGASHVLTTLTLVSATVAAAGLMSAEDKQKVDRMLTDFRSLSLTDTTAAADQATKIVQTLSATLGENPEAITTFTLLAATASKAGLMSAADKSYLDGLPAVITGINGAISDNLARVLAMMGYYECSTAAGTAAKVVSASGYTLTSGGCIRIKMTNANTANNVTLNINSTGAYPLYYDDTQASSTNTWEAGEVLEVYYDGTQYQCASGGGGKFATGEKVKETSITDEITENSTALLESGAVYPMKYDMEQAESTAQLQNVSYEQGSTYNTDGTDATDSKCIRTNYLDVTGVSSITLASTLPNGYTLDMKPTWYNSSRALLQTPSWSAQSAQPITANVPSGAAYLRLVVRVYNGSTQITLTPASATTYSFVLRPFESDSRWYGMLQKCEVLNEIDDVPKNGSQNLVRSNGLYDILFDSQSIVVPSSSLTACNAVIRTSDKKWVSSSSTNNNAALVDVTQYRGLLCRIKKGTDNGIGYTFLTAGVTLDAVATFASGYNAVIYVNSDASITVPSDAVYLYIYLNTSSTSFTPKEVIFGIDDFNRRVELSENVAGDVEKLNEYVFSEDDEQVLAGNSLVSCGGTILTIDNEWKADSQNYGSLINCASFRGKKCIIKKGELNTSYAFLTSGFSAGETPSYATGYNRVVVSGYDVEVIIPDDAVYLYVYLQSVIIPAGTLMDYRPQYVQLGIEGLVEKVKELEQRVDNISVSNSFRIASYNIGHFAHGAQKNSTITSADYETKLAAYRQLIYGYLGADVIGLCEYSAIFGNNGSSDMSAENVLFDRYETAFIGQQYNFSCNALYSNLYIENIVKRDFDCNQNAVITHTSAILATDYYYIEADLWYKGTKIKLIMTHLAFDQNNPQIAANQIAELITKFASETKIIMMGDWNVSSFSQFDAFETAGYTLGNNGSLLTYYDTNLQQALDNIIVKGVSISGVGTIQTTGLSDHLPIYATISLD